MLTELERGLMRHALGLGRSKGSYRNYFVAHNDGPSVPTWRSLVARGLATERPYLNAADSLIFTVTEAGKSALAAAERKAANG